MCDRSQAGRNEHQQTNQNQKDASRQQASKQEEISDTYNTTSELNYD